MIVWSCSNETARNKEQVTREESGGGERSEGEMELRVLDYIDHVVFPINHYKEKLATDTSRTIDANTSEIESCLDGGVWGSVFKDRRGRAVRATKIQLKTMVRD